MHLYNANLLVYLEISIILMKFKFPVFNCVIQQSVKIQNPNCIISWAQYVVPN